MATQYNPARISFLGNREVWVRDIPNIGVDPILLKTFLKGSTLNAAALPSTQQSYAHR